MEQLGYYSDQARPEVRVDCAIAEAEYERRAVNLHTAAQMVAVHAVLEEARSSPEVYVPLVGHPTKQDVEFAERAAVADLAVRLALSENTVRAYESQVVMLTTRTPLVWDRFRWGEVSPSNARVVAELAESIPEGEAVDTFDAEVVDDATRLSPARFRTRARSLREHLVADSAVERHECERAQRRVLVEPDIDGMSWFSAYLPAEVAALADAQLDAEAAGLSAIAGETRTLAQLRADILSDWITGVGSAAPVGVRVGILIPMMTLLGLSEQPASLEGYGPIDADTARRLCGESETFFRILTDPVTGTILDMDKPTRYIPTGLRRMRQIIDQICTFPGCGKRAARCDLDHVVDLQFGGTTKLTNLAHLCRNHHRDKHQTKWSVTQSDDGRIEWTSPTGFVAAPDPPPF